MCRKCDIDLMYMLGRVIPYYYWIGSAFSFSFDAMLVTFS